jgi:uncharacterized membrane protein YvbJ
MTYCNKCGTEIADHTFFCPNCGAEQNPQAPQTYRTYTASPAADDKGGIGWAILGFIFPVIGLIMFLIWRKTKPNRAKSAGMGALVSVGLNLILALFSGFTYASTIML